MNRSRQPRIAAVGAALAVVALLGCGGQGLKPRGLIVPVPDRSARLQFDLRADSAFDSTSTADVILQALAQSVCLLRTERADECAEPDADVPPCSLRSAEEIRTAITPAFLALRQVRLTSPFRIETEVRAVIPGAVATVAVFDARRETGCRQWQQADGVCVAVRVDRLWLLLRGPWGPDGGGPFEVFLAERTCEQNPS